MDKGEPVNHNKGLSGDRGRFSSRLGYVLIVSETALGRMTGKSPVGAFRTLEKACPFILGDGF